MKRLLAMAMTGLMTVSCGVQGMPAGTSPMAIAPVPGTQGVRTAARKLPARDEPALLRHVLYFDEDGDRRIEMGECKRGLQALGLGAVEASGFALLVATTLGPKSSFRATTVVTIDGLSFDNPSKTGIFDPEGRYVPAQFEKVFSRTDGNKDGAIDEHEFLDLAERIKADSVGYQRAKLQFRILAKIAADRTVKAKGETLNALSKARLKSFYNGDLFYDIAAGR